MSNQKLDPSERRAPETEATTKASPEAVIGKRARGGRLNKRLILGIAGAAVVGMLVLNFLPTDRKGKRSDESGAVYVNDAMPQDVREMAMKLPEVKVTPASSTPTPGYGATQSINSPFAGYPSASGPSARSTPAGDGAIRTGKDYSGTAAADARLEAETAARRAPMEVATKLTAGLTVAPSGQSGHANATVTTGVSAPSSAAGPYGVTQETPYVVGGAVPQVAYTSGEIYRDVNDQKTKVDFSVQKAQAIAPNVARPVDPALVSYTIFAGTIIPAALETGINTDLPGNVLATVSENVYDSVTGKNLLIPQGSKLLARYSSNVSFGQNRVQVAWQRLIRPDGVSLQLANMNGVDPQGMSGYTGYVDQHWWEYAKGLGLMLLFSIIDGQIQYSTKEADTQGASDVANSLTAGIDQVGSQYTANAMNIQPTIIVRQGAKVQVFVNSDIIMPPANQKEVLKKYSIPKKDGGTQ